MILIKPGESIRWGKVTFAGGEMIYATHVSEYIKDNA